MKNGKEDENKRKIKNGVKWKSAKSCALIGYQ